MDDAMKAAGMVAGSGIGIGAVMVAWRVVHDDGMVWFVVVAVMGILVLAALCAVLVLTRASLVSWTDAQRVRNEASLIGARALRTLDGIQSRPASGDILGQLIASMPGGDVVDGATPALSWNDDAAFHQGGGE